MRRRLLVLLVLLPVALGGLLWLRRHEAPPVHSSTVASTQPPRERLPAAAPGTSSSDRAGPERLQEARATRDALRARILQALAARPLAPVPPSPPPSRPAAPVNAPNPPGKLTNRGVREALGEQLNRSFMPLVDECIDRAQERSPGLAGLLVLSIETVADEQLGAVVEQAGATSRNEVTDPDLLECIRETALSLRLPPPPGSGREKFEVSLRIQPSAAGLDR